MSTESRLSPHADRVRTVFRTVAVAEAVTWGALLVAMFFKWIVQDDPEAGIEGGVPVAGAVHGGVFVVYVISALVAWRTFGWSLKVLALALAAAVPPFATAWFESRAAERGLLARGTAAERT